MYIRLDRSHIDNQGSIKKERKKGKKEKKKKVNHAKIVNHLVGFRIFFSLVYTYSYIVIEQVNEICLLKERNE